nr:MAG TPA: hypothetical protein [Bacteriophage sp.]
MKLIIVVNITPCEGSNFALTCTRVKNSSLKNNFCCCVAKLHRID